ncbi:RNA-binding motif protein, X-linked 2 [Hondaea fermentalgiana]|uniref:RNA-binding motif protein, X-linked 2 n=1 Tax=Hondaea fermentalgiana TaxID=2315210 RepID=A0A2R5GBU5_9STRA|nr:RNA-binding motif protein, X-linked 2 [Hondaea fermentalgiana]|eukprot:GBG28476.1 RNA-binding motif protein, X-linked 2 [Hondaea fermentalgiana]
MPRNHEPVAYYDHSKRKKRHDPEVGKLTRNYWDLSSDEDEDAREADEEDSGASSQAAPVRLQKEERFRLGERCRALFHDNDSFYPAEIIEVLPLDFSGFKFSYTVQFLKNGTVQHDTRQVDLQRAFYARNKSPLLAAGAACRAVNHDTDEFANASVVRASHGSRGLYTVRFTQTGDEQTHTKPSEIQPNELLPTLDTEGDDDFDDAEDSAAAKHGKGKLSRLNIGRRLRHGKSKNSGIETIWTRARRGDADAVMRFIAHDHVDIDEPEPCGSGPEGKRTALYFAAKHGHLSLVKRLLQAGAQDLDGYVLLDAAPEVKDFLSDYGFGKTSRDARVLVRTGTDRISGERAIEALNAEELRRGIAGNLRASWHADYRDTSWVFLGGLDKSLSEGDVLCVFSQVGEVEDLHLVRDEDTGESRGFAFLKYEDWRSTVLAVDNFNSITLLGRQIHVDHTRYERPKKKKDEEAKLSIEERAALQRPGHAYIGKEIEGAHNLDNGVNPFARVEEQTTTTETETDTQAHDGNSGESKERKRSKDSDKKKKKKKKKKDSKESGSRDRSSRRKRRRETGHDAGGEEDAEEDVDRAKPDRSYAASERSLSRSGAVATPAASVAVAETALEKRRRLAALANLPPTGWMG